jgi:hypothetical protein
VYVLIPIKALNSIRVPAAFFSLKSTTPLHRGALFLGISLSHLTKPGLAYRYPFPSMVAAQFAQFAELQRLTIG